MTTVERIISLFYVKNPSYGLKNKPKNNRKENPEIRDMLRREMEKERLSKNPYANKRIITGLPIYTTSIIKLKRGEIVVAVIETHFDKYF